MIGKVIGAFVGDRLAKQTGGIGGASGDGEAKRRCNTFVTALSVQVPY